MPASQREITLFPENFAFFVFFPISFMGFGAFGQVEPMWCLFGLATQFLYNHTLS
jgi:hypothetical protein